MFSAQSNSTDLQTRRGSDASGELADGTLSSVGGEMFLYGARISSSADTLPRDVQAFLETSYAWDFTSLPTQTSVLGSDSPDERPAFERKYEGMDKQFLKIAFTAGADYRKTFQAYVVMVQGCVEHEEDNTALGKAAKELLDKMQAVERIFDREGSTLEDYAVADEAYEGANARFKLERTAAYEAVVKEASAQSDHEEDVPPNQDTPERDPPADNQPANENLPAEPLQARKCWPLMGLF